MEPLLDVVDLCVAFFTRQGEIRVVDRVSFRVNAGRVMALVGESGSGKTLSVLSVMRLLPERARITGGKIWFAGRDLVELPEAEMRRIRGKEIAMVFQEPMTSLNPVFTVGSQIMEAIRLHQGLKRREAREQAIEMLRMVHVADPERVVDEYPHRLSGGMRQRAMIAMALSCRPRLLIADEPTTALDVTIQAQILDLLAELKERLGLAVLFVTHDLSLVAEYADEVTILYAGRVMERGGTEKVLRTPLSPYTRALIEAIPGFAVEAGEPLKAIPGSVASALSPPPGCRFHPRCPSAIEECARVEPPLEEKAPGQYVACIRV